VCSDHCFLKAEETPCKACWTRKAVGVEGILDVKIMFLMPLPRSWALIGGWGLVAVWDVCLFVVWMFSSPPGGAWVGGTYLMYFNSERKQHGNCCGARALFSAKSRSCCRHIQTLRWPVPYGSSV